MRRSVYGLLLTVLLLPGLAACEAFPQAPPPVTGAERDAILAYSEPMTDNLMAAWTGGDFTAFSRDFGDAMNKALTEADFQKARSTNTAKIGNYVSRTVDHIETRSNGYVVVFYKAKFTEEDPVTMRVSFETATPHHVGGFFFNSPKLER